MANLIYALNSKFGHNDKADGYHDIPVDLVDEQYQEAYEGLTSFVGPLKMKIVDGTIDKAYRAILGMFEGQPVFRNNFVDYPVTPDVDGSVTVCHELVYINSPLDYPKDQLTFPVMVKDLLELQPIPEKGEGGNSGMLRVQSKKVPAGSYKIVTKKLVTLPDRDFLAVKLETSNGKEIKLVGEVWNPEEKCNDPIKTTAAVFETSLNARFNRIPVGGTLVFENKDGKSGQAFF